MYMRKLRSTPRCPTNDVSMTDRVNDARAGANVAVDYDGSGQRPACLRGQDCRESGRNAPAGARLWNVGPGASVPAGARSRIGAMALVLFLGTLVAAGCTQPFEVQRSPATAVISPSTRVAPSALVVVEDERIARGQIDTLVATTARAGERLVVAAPADRVLAGSTSPAPAGVTSPALPPLSGPAAGPDYVGELLAWQHSVLAKCLAGWPLPATPRLPLGGTSYQAAVDRRAVAAFANKTAAACRAGKARYAASLRTWARSQAPHDPPSGDVSLSAALATAVDALGSLQQASGIASRVIVVFCSKLGGTVAAGSLTGDTVVVVSDIQPSVEATTATQAKLYGAGAASVGVLAPADPPGGLADLVDEGLDAKPVAVTLPEVVFANNSARLMPAAAGPLRRVLAVFATTGATGVINGYASSTGSAKHNAVLSQARAESVAEWLEAHGVPSSSLIVIGHGASDFIAAGPSPANRRVTVIVEHPRASS